MAIKIFHIPWSRKWQPTPGFLPGEFHGQRSMVGYSPGGCKSQTQQWLSTHTSNIHYNISPYDNNRQTRMVIKYVNLIKLSTSLENSNLFHTPQPWKTLKEPSRCLQWYLKQGANRYYLFLLTEIYSVTMLGKHSEEWYRYYKYRSSLTQSFSVSALLTFSSRCSLWWGLSCDL